MIMMIHILAFNSNTYRDIASLDEIFMSIQIFHFELSSNFNSSMNHPAFTTHSMDGLEAICSDFREKNFYVSLNSVKLFYVFHNEHICLCLYQNLMEN